MGAEHTLRGPGPDWGLEEAARRSEERRKQRALSEQATADELIRVGLRQRLARERIEADWPGIQNARELGPEEQCRLYHLRNPLADEAGLYAEGLWQEEINVVVWPWRYDLQQRSGLSREWLSRLELEYRAVTLDVQGRGLSTPDLLAYVRVQHESREAPSAAEKDDGVHVPQPESFSQAVSLRGSCSLQRSREELSHPPTESSSGECPLDPSQEAARRQVAPGSTPAATAVDTNGAHNPRGRWRSREEFLTESGEKWVALAGKRNQGNLAKALGYHERHFLRICRDWGFPNWSLLKVELEARAALS